MIHYRIDKRFHVLGAGVQSVSSLWPAAAPVGNWWEAGGATGAIAVYQPKGAASLAASYSNLANPGTNDAAPGAAPSFNTATGWTFNGSTQNLTTGIVPPLDSQTYSVLCAYSSATTNNGYLFGLFDSSGGAGTVRFRYVPITTTTLRGYGHDGQLTITGGAAAAGVAGFAGPTAYFNGSSDGTIPTDGARTTVFPVRIGAASVNSSVTASAHCACVIKAFVMYDNTLDSTEMAAVSAAMAAL